MIWRGGHRKFACNGMECMSGCHRENCTHTHTHTHLLSCITILSTTNCTIRIAHVLAQKKSEPHTVAGKSKVMLWQSKESPQI